jgi:pyroglutamyl-peptidase
MKTNPVVLVTGFAPFGGECINPSWEIAKALPEKIGAHTIRALRVPTVFGKAIEAVTKAIDQHQPSLIISIGQAGGRAAISVERIAINIDDARIADNAGRQPIDEAIAMNGPAAYFATLPVKAMVEAIRKRGIPGEVSNSAGTFVCNHLMYGVLHHLVAIKSTARAGFIHVPFLPSQVTDRPTTSSMTVDMMTAGIEIAIGAALKTKRDRKLIGGALD